MKKRLYLIPKRDTDYPEEIIIKKGMIHTISYMQLASEVPKQMHDKINEPIVDSPINVKVYSCKFKIRKLHPEAVKNNKLKYNYEIIIDYDSPKGPPPKKPTPEALVRFSFGFRDMFIKLNWFEVLNIKYHSFSWSSLDTNQKIKILSIIIGTTISICTILLKIFGYI